jgi:dTDP-glucose 4,6-dehydratase
LTINHSWTDQAVMASEGPRRPGLNPFPELEGKHAVVLGGAGFLGSHICTWMIYSGAQVTCIDNMITGNATNVGHLFGHGGFRLLDYDVTDFLYVPGQVDYVLNFASPASPVDYLKWPIHTLKVGALGTHKGLGLAVAKEAVFFLASTSEVYGDPQVNPQPETYWGNVNPVGPRGVYDEAKRFAEALTLAYNREHGLPVRIVRIFNTFGPRMRPMDGRAVPAFFVNALQNKPLPVHGDGSQTRSLCYVDDLIDGVLRLLLSEEMEPVNLGNPEEVTVLELAELIQEVVGTSPGVEFLARPVDDPTVRRPDTTKAAEVLGWKPQTTLREGLERTLPWFRKVVERP